MRLFRRDKNLVGIARKIRNESNRGIVLADDSRAVALFGGDDLLKQRPSCSRQDIAGWQRLSVSIVLKTKLVA